MASSSSSTSSSASSSASPPPSVLVREGITTVGMHFVATHAQYCARGWIKRIEMLGDGPREFSLYFNETEVARTQNGVITRDSFAPAALADIASKTPSSDPFLCYPAVGEYWNMTFQGRVVIVAHTPPPRQNYYCEQTWAQMFRPKAGASFTGGGGGDDMMLEEVPAMKTFNLRSEDATATILKTTPLACV